MLTPDCLHIACPSDLIKAPKGTKQERRYGISQKRRLEILKHSCASLKRLLAKYCQPQLEFSLIFGLLDFNAYTR